MRRPDIAGWSSLVARRAHNPEVVGSNPAPATKNLQLVGLAGELFCYPGTVFSVQFSVSQTKISIFNIWGPFCRVTVTDRDAGSACGVDDWMPLNVLDVDRLSVGKWVINSLVMGMFVSGFGDDNMIMSNTVPTILVVFCILTTRGDLLESVAQTHSSSAQSPWSLWANIGAPAHGFEPVFERKYGCRYACNSHETPARPRVL